MKNDTEYLPLNEVSEEVFDECEDAILVGTVVELLHDILEAAKEVASDKTLGESFRWQAGYKQLRCRIIKLKEDLKGETNA